MFGLDKLLVSKALVEQGKLGCTGSWGYFFCLHVYMFNVGISLQFVDNVFLLWNSQPGKQRPKVQPGEMNMNGSGMCVLASRKNGNQVY